MNEWMNECKLYFTFHTDDFIRITNFFRIPKLCVVAIHLTMYQLKALFKTHLVLILIIFCVAVVLSKYKNEKSTTDV